MLDVTQEILSNLIFLTFEVLQWWAHTYTFIFENICNCYLSSIPLFLAGKLRRQ